jgi:protein gp37
MAETRLRGRGGYDDVAPFRLTFHPDRLEEPLHLRRGQRIFVCSMSDIGHPDIEWAAFVDVMRIIKRASKHKFMMLTKRPEVLRERFQVLAGTHPYTHTLADVSHLANLPNLWVGVTVENQRRADERIPVLLQIPVHPDAGRFVSVEPMLESIDIEEHLSRCGVFGVCEAEDCQICNSPFMAAKPRVDWVICGAETGGGKRSCSWAWIKDLIDSCDHYGVPFFGKKDCQGKAILPREFPAALESGVGL